MGAHRDRATGLEGAVIRPRLPELFEGSAGLEPWTPPEMPAALNGLLPWRAFDETRELYVNASSIGFAIEIPPFAGIDAETLGALSGTLADAAPERCVVQVIHWASPRFGAVLDAWGAPRREAGAVQAAMRDRREQDFSHAGWRPLHAGGPPFTLSDYRVFICAALPGLPGPVPGTALAGFRRALEGTLASAGAATRRLGPDDLLSLAAELTAPDMAGGGGGAGGGAPRRGAGPPGAALVAPRSAACAVRRVRTRAYGRPYGPGVPSSGRDRRRGAGAYRRGISGGLAGLAGECAHR